MRDNPMPADPFGEPDQLTSETVRHLKQKYAVPDDPSAAARMPIGAALVTELASDKVFHQYMRGVANRDTAFAAFLTRLRRALFFAEWTEDGHEETPVGLITSVVWQCIRSGYVWPEDDEEASWVDLLASELSGINWKAPSMDRQLQLLRLALYRPFDKLSIATTLMMVPPEHWHEQIGDLMDEALRAHMIVA